MDWDVHHGNGTQVKVDLHRHPPAQHHLITREISDRLLARKRPTQDCFWEAKDVLLFSIHRHDEGTFYPGGRCVNLDCRSRPTSFSETSETNFFKRTCQCVTTALGRCTRLVAGEGRAILSTCPGKPSERNAHPAILSTAKTPKMSRKRVVFGIFRSILGENY